MINSTLQQQYLSQFPLFEHFNQEEIDKLNAIIQHKVIPKYQNIYLAGDRSESIYLLYKGTIKIGTHSQDNKEVIKSIIHPMAIFGELALVGEEYRPDFACALKEPVHLFVFHKKDFQQLMQTNANLCIKVINVIGKRLRKTEDRLASLIFKDARTRIIDFIKDSVESRGSRVGYEMLLRHSLTQQDIASLTGTSRQTVTSVLNDLRKSDLIYFTRKSILIRDMAKLA